MAERIIDYTSFSWWESDDLYRWPSNSFFEWENIEVRRNLWWFQCSNKLQDTWYSFDDTIISMKHTDELWIPWWLIVCLNNWKITLDWSLKTTFSTWTTAWNQVIWIWAWKVSSTQYIYYVTRNDSWTVKIHRSNTWVTSFDVSYKSFSVAVWWWSNTRAYCINNNNNLYIATRNVVAVMDLNTEDVTVVLELPWDEEIRWFTLFQDNFTIYTNKWNWSKQYKWDWIDALPYYSQEWINLSVQDVVNDWWYDYAILWFNDDYSNLYLISWTQKKKLRVNLEKSTISRVFSSNISIRNWMVYISWWKSWQSTNYGIYTYWTYYPWTDNSLVQSYTWTTYSFKFHAHTIPLAFFADSNNKVWKIDFENPPAFWYSNWYLVTRMEQWNAWEEKLFKKAKIWFLLQNWSSISIYCRTDISASWKLLKTIDYATYSSKKKVDILATEISKLQLWNFTEIQFKFTLTAWNSSNYTPIVKRFTAFLETVKDT